MKLRSRHVICISEVAVASCPKQADILTSHIDTGSGTNRVFFFFFFFFKDLLVVSKQLVLFPVLDLSFSYVCITAMNNIASTDAF